VATGSTVAGDVCRANFSLELEVVVKPATQQLQYQSVHDKREDNIAWAPTGVIDISRPERWCYIFFSSKDELPDGEIERAGAMTQFLK